MQVWLDGGWGVDALLGEQTRGHEDLDFVVSLDAADDVITALSSLGYTLDEDARPTRFTLSAPGGRKIDVHPVVFDDEGNAVQKGAGPGGGDAPYPAAGFAGHGSISGHAVACLTPQLLVLHHLGYPPADKDRHNVRLLCERFGIPLPGPYL
jgi:lincosamide nucleotidyltransferase A/C/D/E